MQGKCGLLIVKVMTSKEKVMRFNMNMMSFNKKVPVMHFNMKIIKVSKTNLLNVQLK